MSCDVNVDRISSLPKNIIEAILMYLPIEDAVRTSILSRDWRYAWSSIPQLAFSWNEFPLPEGQSQVEYDRRLVKIIYQVLLLHQGPIHKFELSIDLVSSRDIDRWILFLSRNGIKEIILEKWEGQVYKLPSSLFSCEGITCLRLYRCIFAPSLMKGFPSLASLDLSSVIISQDELEALIALCPLLNKLVLKDINGCNHLKICSRSLVDLSIQGELVDLSFENTPLLATLYVRFSMNNDQDYVASGAISKLFRVLDSLSSIKKLELGGRTFEIWAVGDIPVSVKLPITCQLKHLSAAINFEDIQEMLTAFSLFRSSPFLSNLNIRACSSGNGNRSSAEDFWGAQESFDCLFSHLRILKVTNIVGVKSELVFVKFVLANAPVLKTAYIKFNQNVNNELSILKEMIQYKRMSAEAEILFVETD